jgi:hypothetical protein
MLKPLGSGFRTDLRTGTPPVQPPAWRIPAKRRRAAGFPQYSMFVSVAALDIHLSTRTHRLKLIPKGFVHLFELRVLFGCPIAREVTGTAVVRGVGRSRQVASRLFVLLFSQRISGEVVKQDLAARMAVVLDIAA